MDYRFRQPIRPFRVTDIGDCVTLSVQGFHSNTSLWVIDSLRIKELREEIWRYNLNRTHICLVTQFRFIPNLLFEWIINVVKIFIRVWSKVTLAKIILVDSMESLFLSLSIIINGIIKNYTKILRNLELFLKL